MRLKLQVEAKPLVGPGLGTIGDCQKKRQGLKDMVGHPYSLCSCEEVLGVRQHSIFNNKAILFFVSDNTIQYDMLSAQSRRFIWFLYTFLQVGNAVPPPLGRALGLSIRQAMV